MRHKNKEKRRYIRLTSVFPVDFRLVLFDKQTFLTDWCVGFTNNISRGGIALSFSHIRPELIKEIKETRVDLLLNIHIPLFRHSAYAKARPVWIEEVPQEPGHYIVGLSYIDISPKANTRIVHYAWFRYLILRVGVTILIILFLGVSVSGYFNYQLVKRNRFLVKELVKTAQNLESRRMSIARMDEEKESLVSKLSNVQGQIKDARTEKAGLEMELVRLQLAMERKEFEEEELQRRNKELETLNKKMDFLIEGLNRERVILKEELSSLKEKEVVAAETLLVLDEKRSELEKANFEQMYQWLEIHQNPRTGLMMSFEGDSSIANWAFLYDQALVACVLTQHNQFKKTQKLFDFFKYQAEKVNGGFINAYYVNDGSPSEYIVHCGPNIWLGIAILQYTNKTEDKRYLGLAQDIAHWIIGIQSEDREGGLRGGPKVSWFATEHNLDAYAFLNMLYKITQDTQYLKAADRILAWLIQHTYDRSDIPVKRGRGDSTIATDTYAWSIAALGPQKLEELGLSSNEIMKFAEDTCSVEVNFSRPDGEIIRVRGFDFAAQRNLARGGVISCEWSAQMVLSFKIMADFYKEKRDYLRAQFYQQKADDYLNQLTQMIISSSSPSGQGRGCLPYASDDYVDTGHGWMTPKGDSTGSVSATCYALFAYYGFNPLSLEE